MGNPEQRRWSTVQRLGVTALALLLLVPLGVAGSLKPSRSRYGTHQQLGLPPCSVTVLLGVRCPLCGGTTAWANLVRGRLREALAANSSATLLGVLCVAAVPWLLGSALRGRWVLWTPHSTPLAWGAVTLMALMLVEWLVRLMGS